MGTRAKGRLEFDNFTMAILSRTLVGVLTATFACIPHETNAFLKPHLGTVSSLVSIGEPSSTRLHIFDFLNEGKKALVKKLAGDYDSVAIRERLDGLIKENSVLMLSFTTCPFCVKAKQVLDAKNAKYVAVELDMDPEGKAIRAEMGELLGRTSVPAVWIDGKFVGGCNDGPMGGLVKLDEAGDLDGMLKAAGSI